MKATVMLLLAMLSASAVNAASISVAEGDFTGGFGSSPTDILPGGSLGVGETLTLTGFLDGGQDDDFIRFSSDAAIRSITIDVNTTPDERNTGFTIWSDLGAGEIPTPGSQAAMAATTPAPIVSLLVQEGFTTVLAATSGPFLGSEFFILLREGGDNTSSYTVSISTVPLPAAAWLFFSAFVGLVSLSRRRQGIAPRLRAL
jgi:hypothetical protein